MRENGPAAEHLYYTGLAADCTLARSQSYSTATCFWSQIFESLRPSERSSLCRRFIVVNCPVDLKVIYNAAQVLGRSSSHDHARQGSFRPRDWFRDWGTRLVSEPLISRQSTQLTASSTQLTDMVLYPECIFRLLHRWYMIYSKHACIAAKCIETLRLQSTLLQATVASKVNHSTLSFGLLQLHVDAMYQNLPKLNSGGRKSLLLCCTLTNIILRLIAHRASTNRYCMCDTPMLSGAQLLQSSFTL